MARLERAWKKAIPVPSLSLNHRAFSSSCVKRLAERGRKWKERKGRREKVEGWREGRREKVEGWREGRRKV